MSDRIAAADGPLVDGVRSVEHAAGRLKDRIVTGAQDRRESSRDYVSWNPVKSVLVAAGVGALLGYFLGRRRSQVGCSGTEPGARRARTGAA